MADWLVSNWFGVVSLLVGTVVSVYLALRFNKSRRPSYAMRNVVIVEKAKEAFPELRVHWRGVGDDLDNLSVAVIAIWNAGRETVRKEDVAKADPIRIDAVGDVKILGAKVIQINCESNLAGCTYEKVENRVLVVFDYLDYMQGCVLEVAHTGNLASSIRVAGTIKGAAGLCHVELYRRSRLSRVLLGGNRSSYRKARQRVGIFFVSMSIIMAMMQSGIMLSPFIYDRTRKYISADDGVYIEARHYGSDYVFHYEYVDGNVVTNMTPLWIAMYVLQLLISLYLFRYGYKLVRKRIPYELTKFEDHLL